MEPLAAIAIAKSIASATGFDDWIRRKLDGAVGDKTAQTIIDVASLATGQKSPQKALEAIKTDPQAAERVAMDLKAKEHELTLAALEDVQSARKMYGQNNAMADKIAYRVITHNHWLVAMLLVANGLVVTFIDEKVVAVALGNLIGTSIGALWQERQQVIGFFFGSSMGSKLKDFMAGGSKRP